MDTPAVTARGHPEQPPGPCWCCGSLDYPAGMVHLGNHPEVAMCRPCARWAANKAREIEDRDKTGPLVLARDGIRAARRTVIEYGWHRNRWVGGPLRWLGKRLP